MSYENSREIDLKDLFFHVLRSWRSLFAAGLIGLVLLGSYKYFSAERIRTENETLESAGREDEIVPDTAYRSAFDALRKKEREIRALEVKVTGKNADIAKAQSTINEDSNTAEAAKTSAENIKGQLESIEIKLAGIEKYMNESVRMKVDPYARPTAQAIYQVALTGNTGDDEKLYRDPADEIVSAYGFDLSFDEAKKSIREKYGMDFKYIEELYSVESDILSNTVAVKAFGTDAAMAEDILSAVCSAIEGRQEDISSRYRSHVLREMSRETFESVDQELASEQNSRVGEMLTYRSQIEQYRSSLNAKEMIITNMKLDIDAQNEKINDLKNDISELEEDIDNLERELPALSKAVEAKVPARMRSVKDGIKSGVIGLFAAIILLAAWYCAVYVLKGVFRTADEIRNYYDIPLLGVLSRKPGKKNTFIDGWIARLECRGRKTSDEEAVRTAAATVSGLAKKGSTVVLLSTHTSKSLLYIAEHINELISDCHFIPVADIESAAENIEELGSCDAVILVEERGVSSLDGISLEIGRAKLMEKRILGYIAV